ncbi:Protein NRDE2 [Thelohanellus kitauei]|uniref:Protein NRDE2 n=1 Tax=Thelohanellus kitauei TaxID=669202 RepID=A0A0C2JDJ4_THEKT|nr:Protein NRDE2 [Thelohanellus kitauei]
MASGEESNENINDYKSKGEQESYPCLFDTKIGKHEAGKILAPQDEYVEFDRDILGPSEKMLSEKIKTYWQDPLKLIQKKEKLKRKAIVKMSHEKPGLVDQSNKHKIKYIVDLNGRTSKQRYPQKFRYKKAPKKVTLGKQSYIERSILTERYYSLKFPSFCQKIDVLDKNYVISDKATVPKFDLVVNTSTEEESIKICRRIANLNKKVNDQPNDIASWLKLVDMQQEKLGKNMTTKSVADSQLAVLDAAINRNPKSEELLIRRLYIVHNVSDSNSLRSALDRIVFSFPNKISFWTIYFQYNQADFNKLSIKHILDLYIKALKKVESLKSLAVRPSQRLADPMGSEFQLKLYCQLCVYLLGTDHQEKLISLLQMVVEYNFSQHPNHMLNKFNDSDLLLYLESFWDSDMPKIGGKGARGFANFIKSGTEHKTIINESRVDIFKDIFLKPPRPNETQLHQYETQLYHSFSCKEKAWLAMEHLRSNRDVLPAKSNRDVEDMERIVLFDDVKSLVFKIDYSLHFEMSLLFLLVLGVPVPSKFCPVIGEILKDCLLFSDTVLQLPDSLIHFVNFFGSNLILSRKLSPIWLYFKCDDPSSNLFPDPNTLELIRNLFTSFISYIYFNDEQIRMLSFIWLQYEVLIATTYPSEYNNYEFVLKFSKILLSLPENRQFLTLWMLYSFCLLYAGKAEQYQKIVLKLIDSTKSAIMDPDYGTLITSFAQSAILNDLLNSLDRKLIVGLLHDFTSQTLEVTYESCFDINNALFSRISCVTRDSLIGCFHLIFCQFFEAVLTHNFSTAISNLIKWIEYCSKNCLISGLSRDLKCYPFKQRVYDNNSQIYQLCQLLSERFSEIIWHPAMYQHVNYDSFRNIVYLCVVMFPNSVRVLQWFYRYLQNEPTYIAFRPCFNYILSNCNVSTNSNISSWIFNIYTEISYIEKVSRSIGGEFLKESSSSYRLRCQFEKMCSDPNTMFRPLIWRIYMRILELYMDCVYFEILDSRSINDMMVEKGIRVRLPIDELEIIYNS